MNTMPKPWSLLEKTAFRFFCCFFLIYLFPFPLNVLELISPFDSDNPPKFIKWYYTLFGYYDTFLHAFIPWVGRHILHLANPITIFTNGSGDTTYDYVALFTFFMLSILATIIWSVLDRRRASYVKTHIALRILIRYILGFYMISYGFYKVFHLQMLSPYLTQLVQPFGDKSPMGLAWSFVGYSKGFSAFTGWGEVVGGLLLFFRRTTTLGSLLVIVVISNVVAINFFYDVPVKLFSSMLLLMAVFLLAPDAGRLWDVLYRNRPTYPRQTKYFFTGTITKIAWLVLKIFFIGMAIYTTLNTVQKGNKQYGDSRTLPHYYGIYNVSSWVKNKDTVPPLLTDPSRWKRLILQFPGYATVYKMNDSSKNYVFEVDSTFKTATIYPQGDTTQKSKLSIQGDSSTLMIAGLLVNDS
ncbi:MAG: DoxX family membrane protein, partial [Bacteroidetes bacterium]|nr:DoxX family membrane protein [Bacteroidota bacterium]